jgi:hypothetical protein
MVCSLAICPTERIVTPPILRTSLGKPVRRREDCVDLLVQQQMTIAKWRPLTCQ